MALRRKGFELIAARPFGDERPWSKMPRVTDSAQAPVRPAPRDATPRTEGLEIGD
jgi:hypothetical protein